MKKLLLGALCCAMISGCAYISYMKDPFTDIRAFAKVSDSIYRGGQPRNPDGYDRLRALGVKTILNLSQDTKRVQDESRWASANNIAWHHLPVSLYTMPSDEQALRFLEIALTADKPLFIHCEDGRDRTGTMVALLRVAAHGWTIKQAYDEARSIGYWPYHGDDAPLKMFVHQLKDKSLYFVRAKELMDANN